MPLEISIVCAGKLKEKWLREACAEYVKRLTPYARIELREVADAPDSLGPSEAREQEAGRLEKQIPAHALLIALAIEGDMVSSEDFARHLDAAFTKGGSRICFLIGGSNGLAPRLLERADQRWSLSRLTFTHLMSRLILLEQLYRSFRILRNEPYHK